MSTSRIDRSDDTAATLKIIATVSGTEDAVTKQWQACTIADSTDPVNNKLAVDSSGRLINPALAATAAKQPALGTAGTASADVITVQGIASMTPLLATATMADGANVTLGAKADAKSTATDTTAVTAMSVLKQISASVQAPPSQAVTNGGTFAVQAAITAASGSISSGAISSGAIASGAIASGAVASGAVASGAFASGSIADGADVTLGAKGDAKSTATDTTAVTAMSVLKQISASVQAPPSQAVTNTGTFAVQAAITAASGSIGSGAIASGAVASGAIASGAVASGAVASGAFVSGSLADGANVTLGAKADAKSTATDTTSVTAMQVLKQISASVQAPPSQAVTNAGTFVVQENGTQVQVDDAAFTPATSKIVMVGFEADESSTDSVDEGDGGAARMTLDRKVIVTPQPHSAGGLSTINSTSSDGGTALTNSAQVIKASAGQLYGYYICNPNTADSFVCFYNTAAASVTVGTTNPLFLLRIPAGTAANLMFPYGVAFGTAMSWAVATTAGGATAPTNALDAVCWYF